MEGKREIKTKDTVNIDQLNRVYIDIANIENEHELKKYILRNYDIVQDIRGLKKVSEEELGVWLRGEGIDGLKDKLDLGTGEKIIEQEIADERYNRDIPKLNKGYGNTAILEYELLSQRRYLINKGVNGEGIALHRINNTGIPRGDVRGIIKTKNGKKILTEFDKRGEKARKKSTIYTWLVLIVLGVIAYYTISNLSNIGKFIESGHRGLLPLMYIGVIILMSLVVILSSYIYEKSVKNKSKKLGIKGYKEEVQNYLISVTRVINIFKIVGVLLGVHVSYKLIEYGNFSIRELGYNAVSMKLIGEITTYGVSIVVGFVVIVVVMAIGGLLNSLPYVTKYQINIGILTYDENMDSEKFYNKSTEQWFSNYVNYILGLDGKG